MLPITELDCAVIDPPVRRSVMTRMIAAMVNLVVGSNSLPASGQVSRDSEPLEFEGTDFEYLLTSNLEIGARVGWGLNRDAPNFFSNVGVGRRY